MGGSSKASYVNAPLLPPDFLKKYNTFIELCYDTYSGWGQDAKLKTKYKRRKDAARDKWQDSWAEHFASENNCTEPATLRDTYGQLVAYLANELGIGVQAEVIETGRLPKNIR